MKKLDEGTTRGSRRHVLDWMERPDFTQELLSLCGRPGVKRATNGQHFPRGWGEAEEARLELDGGKLLPDSPPVELWSKLGNWWLANRRGANTPNWDIAMPIDVDGVRGLLLVEAKANLPELGTGGKPEPATTIGTRENQVERSPESIQASIENHERIKSAIDEARDGLARLGVETRIDRDTHYQLSNRLALAWWLANKGIPVVLLYLGFTADEGVEGYFADDSSWDDEISEYFGGVGADWLLNSNIDVNGTPLWVLSRSRKVLQPSPELPNRTGRARVAARERLWTHAGLSRVPGLSVRFTNSPEARMRRLVNDPDIQFIALDEPMTKEKAAEWLSLHPECMSAEWRSALADIREPA